MTPAMPAAVMTSASTREQRRAASRSAAATRASTAALPRAFGSDRPAAPDRSSRRPRAPARVIVAAIPGRADQPVARQLAAWNIGTYTSSPGGRFSCWRVSATTPTTVDHLRPSSAGDAPADRVLARPVMLRHRLAHDDDRVVAAAVGGQEHTPGDQRLAERLEVAGRDDPHVDMRSRRIGRVLDALQI